MAGFSVIQPADPFEGHRSVEVQHFVFRAGFFVRGGVVTMGLLLRTAFALAPPFVRLCLQRLHQVHDLSGRGRLDKARSR